MGKIIVEHDAGGIKGLCIITPTVYSDSRGSFSEVYNRKDMEEEGLMYHFVQDNQSVSSKGVIRGLHFQIKYPQAKLLHVTWGAIYDVAVDLRNDSPTFGKHLGVILSKDNNKQLLIPPGFAHGFLVVSDKAGLSYKCDNYYHPDDEGGIIWDDKDLGIEWPVGSNEDLILSEKDKSWGDFRTYCLLNKR